MFLMMGNGTLFYAYTGDSANAVPHTKKLHTRVAHIWGNRRLQPNRSAMEWPRPGETAFLITVLPVPGKYATMQFSKLNVQNSLLVLKGKRPYFNQQS